MAFPSKVALETVNDSLLWVKPGVTHVSKSLVARFESGTVGRLDIYMDTYLASRRVFMNKRALPLESVSYISSSQLNGIHLFPFVLHVP